MDELKPSRVDLTGRQRSLWRLVLLRLEAGGLLQSSLPAALQPLRTGMRPADPEAWIDLAETKGQVLPWLLRQLTLMPDDATLASLGSDLGLCICSRERLQASQGWCHWAGLDSAVEGYQGLLEGRPAAEQQGRPRALELEAWAQRLLCLWWVGRTLAGPASVARSLVLDLDPAPLLPLAERPAPLSRWSDDGVAWQLGALPRHAMDVPERREAWFSAAPPALERVWMAGLPDAEVQAPGAGPTEVCEPAQRWYARPAPPCSCRSVPCCWPRAPVRRAWAPGKSPRRGPAPCCCWVRTPDNRPSCAWPCCAAPLRASPQVAPRKVSPHGAMTPSRAPWAAAGSAWIPNCASSAAFVP